MGSREPAMEKKTRKIARMIDVARRAGVSQPTVSHVLSGDYRAQRVSEETAEKVRRAAKHLRYHPNHAARQLTGKRSGVLAALATTWRQHPFRPRFHSFLAPAADACGFKVLSWQSENQVARIQKYVPELLARKVDALVYVALGNDALWPQVAPLLAELPCVVSVLGDPCVPGGSVVLSDPAEGVRQAVAHLHRQGRRKIVQVFSDRNSTFDLDRRRGLLNAHREFSLAIDPDRACLFSKGSIWDVTNREHFDICEAIIALGADAVLADDDFCAALLIRALVASGRRVPDDVAVIGSGNETISRFFMPSLTTIDWEMSQFVQATLDIVVTSQEEGGAAGPRRVVVPPQLIVRESA